MEKLILKKSIEKLYYFFIKFDDLDANIILDSSFYK